VYDVIEILLWLFRDAGTRLRLMNDVLTQRRAPDMSGSMTVVIFSELKQGGIDDLERCCP
jgi:hypothetical protein